MDEQRAGQTGDEEWAETRRLRLLRRRRLIAALALLGVIVLLALGILRRVDANDASGSAHGKPSSAPAGASPRSGAFQPAA